MIWKVYLTCSDSHSGGLVAEGAETIEAACLDEAKEAAEELSDKWTREMFDDDNFHEVIEEDWPSRGYSVQARFFAEFQTHWEIESSQGTAVGEDGEPMAEDTVRVRIKLHEEALVRAAGGNPDCQHEWDIADPHCGPNNSLHHHDRCLLCGLQKSMTTYSHAPDMNTVCYKQPKYWCPKCQSDKVPCGCHVHRTPSRPAERVVSGTRLPPSIPWRVASRDLGGLGGGRARLVPRRGGGDKLG
jgi:hypothetical protein